MSNTTTFDIASSGSQGLGFLLAPRYLLVVALSACIWRLLRNRNWISIDNLPGPPPGSWFKGNFGQLFNIKDGWEFHAALARQYGPIARATSLLGERQIYTFDPKAMHHIFVKDQMVWEESTQFIEGNRLIFGMGLLSTLGDHHRKQRKMLNPVFSIAHMRAMLPTFYEVTHKLRKTILQKVRNGPQEIDMLEWMSRTALEIIGQSGLGYSFDSLEEGSQMHQYLKIVKELPAVFFRLFFARNYVLPWAVKIGTPSFRRFVVNLIPSENVHRLRDMADYMYTLSTEVYTKKKHALEEGDEAVLAQIGRGKDILSVLMKENMKAEDEDKLNEDELIGQMSTLIFAAMDTTSGAMSRLLSLLTVHTNVQERLRAELIQARREHGDLDLPYDALVDLPYLDAVCRETLRLYPPISQLLRTSRQDIVLPLSSPVRGLDGKQLTEVAVPKNTNVIVSLWNSNRNPDVWGPDAHEWKPERWLDPLPDSVKTAHIPGVYSHLMTFIGGGRSCIGFKFSQLEMKVVISLLVEIFKFEPADKDVFWQMTPIASPIVRGGGDGRPHMPIKVSLAK